MHIVFNHGKESGPYGNKIMALIRTLDKSEHSYESIDYTGVYDPDERIGLLLEYAKSNTIDILVGSSMGGYVATVASRQIAPKGLFLLAPAFGISEYPEMYPAYSAKKIQIIHGWNDTLVDPEAVLKYARDNKIDIRMINSEHTLNDAIPIITRMFKEFVDSCL